MIGLLCGEETDNTGYIKPFR